MAVVLHALLMSGCQPRLARFLVWRYVSDYGDWHGEPLSDAEMATVIEKSAGHR